jgi:hypothetical protein
VIGVGPGDWLYDRQTSRQPNLNPGAGTTATPDMSLGASVRINLPNGAVTIGNPSFPLQGDELTMALVSGGTLTVVTWGTKYLRAGGVAPTLSLVAAAIDVITFKYDSISDRWLQKAGPLLGLA